MKQFRVFFTSILLFAAKTNKVLACGEHSPTDSIPGSSPTVAPSTSSYPTSDSTYSNAPTTNYFIITELPTEFPSMEPSMAPKKTKNKNKMKMMMTTVVMTMKKIKDKEDEF